MKRKDAVQGIMTTLLKWKRKDAVQGIGTTLLKWKRKDVRYHA